MTGLVFLFGLALLTLAVVAAWGLPGFAVPGMILLALVFFAPTK